MENQNDDCISELELTLKDRKDLNCTDSGRITCCHWEEII